MSYKHLRDENYYNDVYDHFTVEECRRREKGFLNASMSDYKAAKTMSPERQQNLKRLLAELALYFIKGERYTNKSTTINEWMREDKEKDEFVEKAQLPRGIHCPECRSLMNCTDRELYWDKLNGKDRVLFFYECSRCSKKQGVFDNGEIFESSPMLCPKCKHKLKTTYKRTEKIIETIYSCFSCDYKEIETLDLNKPEKEEDDEQYLVDRKRFCISDEEGSEYIGSRASVNRMQEILDDDKHREENKELYDQLAKLKKLTVAELEQLLITTIEKEEYKRLELLKPEFDKNIIVSFTVQDGSPSRKEYDSVHNLQKLIRTALEDTNWRLMSEGVSYKLGYLQGRVKGYEAESDLLMLVQKSLKKQPISVKT